MVDLTDSNQIYHRQVVSAFRPVSHVHPNVYPHLNPPPFSSFLLIATAPLLPTPQPPLPHTTQKKDTNQTTKKTKAIARVIRPARMSRKHSRSAGGRRIGPH